MAVLYLSTLKHNVNDPISNIGNYLAVGIFSVATVQVTFTVLLLCCLGGFLDNLRRHRSSGGMTVITGKRPGRGSEGGTRGKSATPLHELADEQPCVMGEKEEEGEGSPDVQMRLHSPQTVSTL